MNPFGDPRKLMKQFQQAQERLQAEIAALVIEATAGGGMVTVEMDGQKQVRSLKIDPQVDDKNDVDMLQDLVLAAIILAGLPGTAAWALGVLVGVNMIFGGTALIAMALHARRAG